MAARFLERQTFTDNEAYFSIALLFLLSFLSYGLLIPWLGFYWDDWLNVWVGRAQGAGSIAEQMTWYRPFLGILFSFTYTLVQDNLFIWQVFSFALSLLSSVLVLWALRGLWPERRFGTMVMAVLFTVYPGFLGAPHGQVYHGQYVLLCLNAFSLGATIRAQTVPGRKTQFVYTFLALISGLMTLFLYELFVAAEVLRFVIICYLTWGRGVSSLRSRVISIVKRWTPYLLMLSGLLIWRLFFFTATNVTADVSLIAQQYRLNPINELIRILAQAPLDFLEVTVLAWFVPLFGRVAVAADGAIVFSVMLGAGTFVLMVLYCRRLNNEELNRTNSSIAADHNWSKAALLLGFVATLMGLVPAVMAGLDVRLLDLLDRLSVPVMIAIGLFTGGLIFTVITSPARPWVVAGLVGLAVVAHFHNANLYRNIWQDEMNLWWQMSWRVPGLEPETVLVVAVPETAVYPQEEYTYEVWAPANMIYAPESDTPLIYGVRLSESVARKIVVGEPLEYRVLSGIHFEMDFDNTLVLLAPTQSSCLRIIDGNRVELPSTVYSRTRLVASYSQIDRIRTDGTHAAPPPAQIFGNEPAHTWCYYFERAELARQTGDWQQIIALADDVRERGFHPDDETEWLPFIEAYATTGRCQEALELATLVQESVPALQSNRLLRCQ